MKYKTKPVEIEAVQWTGLNLEEVKAFAGDSLEYAIFDTAWRAGKNRPRVLMKIKTLEGDMKVSEGDYIVKGLKGEFYPCKPDIFEMKYETSSQKETIEQSKEEAKNLNELTDHLIRLLESDDKRFSFEFCAGGVMEIYDKEKEIGYAACVTPIKYDEKGNATNL